MVSIAGLDAVEKRNTYSPCQESNHHFSVIQRAAYSPYQPRYRGCQYFIKSILYGRGVPVVSITDTEGVF
jgi:hypothetical protein